ncbi:lytic transglycosylase domain-containing protein [Helicobacter pametensis]|uniref:lytic transglycosylase domain-containing protein n=1 Tax=Helicobacter pametensis TaxID=95149 RepID=UPI0004B77D16|nr:lytic transglycosylase domain-containing protein [Helicobacter pametensis]
MKKLLISCGVGCLLLSEVMGYGGQVDFKMPQVRSSEGILNSFDLDVSFLPALNQANMTYERSVQARWEYFVQKFDQGYEVIPTLRLMMAEAGIPQEFLFLAMAESEFSMRAYSPKKASGIWQLMPKTAKELGLQINDYIDERRDPIKSTKAAIRYLKYLKNVTGEWYLAAMAYNCGIGRLQKAIKKAGTKDIQTLIDPHKAYLPKETRYYIRMILGMSLAFNNADVLKNENKEYFLNRGASSTITGVEVDAGTPLLEIAQSINLSLEELKKYNKHFRYNFLPPGKGKYTVYVPYNKLSAFKQNFQPTKNQNTMYVLHRVKKGETFYSIAKKYKTSVQELQTINELKNDHLAIKQSLIIPILKENYKKRIAQNR